MVNPLSPEVPERSSTRQSAVPSRVALTCALVVTLLLGARYWIAGDPHSWGPLILYESPAAIALATLLAARSTERIDTAAQLAYAGVCVLLFITFAVGVWTEYEGHSSTLLLRVTNMSWALISLTLAGSVTMLCAALMLGRPLRIWLIIGGIAFVALLVSARAFVFR
jgi:hypothetical protein